MITTNYISIKTKEAFVKEDYTLKSPYFFIVLNILAILCGAILLKSEINLITFIVYALPITLGLYFEIKHIRIYNTLDLGIEKIRKLLNISTIILANCILFISSFFLILGNKIIENILLKASYSNSINFSDFCNNRNYGDYGSYVFTINIYIIVFFLILWVFSLIFFFIGMKFEKIQVMKNRKKKYYPVIGIFILIPLFKRFFESIPYIYLLIFIIFTIFLMSYAIGMTYFRYRNFDKKVVDSNKLIDYTL